MAKPKPKQNTPPPPPPKPQMGQPPQRREMDINQALSKLIDNNNNIAKHVQALKLLAKGMDLSELEAANTENAQIIVSLIKFLQSQEPLPGKPTNRAERRRAERDAKKQQKHGNKAKPAKQ